MRTICRGMVESIPNVHYAGGTSRPRYFQIRGIGERSHYAGEGPPNFSVGFVMDDVDLSGLGMAALAYDLDQVEVYRGPQSAVFGPNALAGLIASGRRTGKRVYGDGPIGLRYTRDQPTGSRSGGTPGKKPGIPALLPFRVRERIQGKYCQELIYYQ